MPKTRSLFLAVFLLALPPAFLAAGLEDAPEYLSAHQALSDGLPSVAAVKAQRLLKHKGWTRVETRRLATFAAEAWTRAAEGTRVMELAETYDLDDEPFWRGQGLALTGQLAAARDVLTAESPDHPPQHPRTRLLLAQILGTLGENAAARSTLAPLLTSPDAALQNHARLLQSEIDINEGKPATTLPPNPDQDDAATRFLRARSLVQAGSIAPAQRMLSSVINSPQGGERMHQAAEILQVETLLQQHRAAEAQEQLMKFLDSTPDCPLWIEAFNLLNRVHQELPEPRTLPEGVLRWISSGNTAQQQPDPAPVLVTAMAEFRGYAFYLTAQWLAAQKRHDEAVSLLESLIQLFPEHPRISDAMQLAIEIYASQHIDQRVEALAEARHQKFGTTSVPVDFALGGILFRRGETQAALKMFQDAANVATTLTERRRALFNAGLAAISASDFTLYHSLLSQLQLITSAAGTGPESKDSAATLELEKALHLAAHRKPEAEAALRDFIRTHSGHPRYADACIALTEWFLLAQPPRIQDAQLSLNNATTPAQITSAQQQRIQYTRLWLNDAAGDLKTLIAHGAEFIKLWPQSPLLPDVRMKIAGAYYRLEDFANARTEFEIIARDYPDTQHADTALYFAAMSATSVMSEDGRKRALAIWEELAQKNSPLAVAARRQEALSERLQGNHAAALAVLDKVLAMKTLEPDQRLMALCEKAELLLLLGKSDPARLDAAADLLDEFLEDHSLPFLWKARAGFTLASVHHDARHDTEALEACYNVLRAADMTPPASPADYNWFSKAGFFGVDLLEASRQWEAAARLAEQIAQRPGDRAAEARERATKIRLEHFLWDGPAPKLPTVLKLDETPGKNDEDKAPSKSPKKKGK